MWCSQVYGAMLFNSLPNDQKGRIKVVFSSSLVSQDMAQFEFVWRDAMVV